MRIICSIFILILFNTLPSISGADSDTSKHTMTGVVTAITPKGTAAFQSFSSGKANIVTSVKGYEVAFRNSSGVTKICLGSCFPVKRGDTEIMPKELRKNEDRLKVTFSANAVCKDQNDCPVASVEVVGSKVNRWLYLFIAFILTLVIYSVIAGVFIKEGTGLCVGSDGRYSNSKFQIILWTFLVMFSYIATYISAMNAGGSVFPIISIPQSLGILMGISTGSFLGAKAIVTSKVANGTWFKPELKEGEKASLLQLIQNDYKNIDFGDAQMVAWMLVAAGIYLFNVYEMLEFVPVGGAITLPDVDSTLLVLTGVSQGAYIGKKLVQSETPLAISMIKPPDGALPGTMITITGTAFGPVQGNGYVSVSGIPVKPAFWYDTSIGLVIPTAAPVGAGTIQVVTNVLQAFEKDYTILPVPTIVDITPPNGAKPGAAVSVSGTSFGVTQGQGSITICGIPVTPTYWYDTLIKFAIPAGTPTGKGALQVVNNDMRAAVKNYDLLPPPNPPSISNINPPAGAPVGSKITITGTGFGASQGGGKISISGVPGNPSSWSDSIIEVTVPAVIAAGSVKIKIENSDSLTIESDYTVIT